MCGGNVSQGRACRLNQRFFAAGLASTGVGTRVSFSAGIGGSPICLLQARPRRCKTPAHTQSTSCSAGNPCRPGGPVSTHHRKISITKKLDGKVAVITGGSAGIGLGTAKRFAAEGARVYITGRRQAGLDKGAGEKGPAATAIRADASKLADIDCVYDIVKKQVGHIDILFA